MESIFQAASRVHSMHLGHWCMECTLQNLTLDLIVVGGGDALF